MLASLLLRRLMLHIYQCVTKIFHRRSYGTHASNESFMRQHFTKIAPFERIWAATAIALQRHHNHLPHMKCTRAGRRMNGTSITEVAGNCGHYYGDAVYLEFQFHLLFLLLLLAIELMRCSGALLILPTLCMKLPRRMLLTFPREGANPRRKLWKRTTHSNNPFHKHIARF